MNFQKNDKVYSLSNGNGVVYSVLDAGTYSVCVEFDSFTKVFTQEGKRSVSDKYPILFHGHDLKVKIEDIPPERDKFVNLYTYCGCITTDGKIYDSYKEANLRVVGYYDKFLKTVCVKL